MVPGRTQPWRRFHFAQSGGLPGGMASLMEANDAGFGCDLALWEPVRLTAAVDGLAVGTAGVVVGWTGEAYRVAPSCITARERPVVARPEELAPRERPPIAGAEALERTPVVYGDSDFGACALCEADGARKLGLVSPLYTCCGGSVCAPCASALGDHGIGDTCPLCGDAAHLKRGLEEVATVARRLARKGEPRAFYGLAAMDELLSVEESSRYLLALVERGYGEAMRAAPRPGGPGRRVSGDRARALGSRTPTRARTRASSATACAGGSRRRTSATRTRSTSWRTRTWTAGRAAAPPETPPRAPRRARRRCPSSARRRRWSARWTSTPRPAPAGRPTRSTRSACSATSATGPTARGREETKYSTRLQSNGSDQPLRPCFEHSMRAINSSKNQPNRLRAREF